MMSNFISTEEGKIILELHKVEITENSFDYDFSSCKKPKESQQTIEVINVIAFRESFSKILKSLLLSKTYRKMSIFFLFCQRKASVVTTISLKSVLTTQMASLVTSLPTVKSTVSLILLLIYLLQSIY